MALENDKLFEESVDIEQEASNWIHHGKDIPLDEVPVRIRELIARCIAPSPDHEWMLFAAQMGIHDQQTLNEIKGDAFVLQRWPTEVLLINKVTYLLNSKSFKDVIEALLALQQIRILQQLHDSGFVNDFFKTYERKSSVPGCLPTPEKSLLQDNENQNRPIVLLTYSKDVNDWVPVITTRLQQEGFGVLSEEVLQRLNILQVNPIATLQSYYHQVHLVVPILSDQYLLDIKKRKDDSQSKNVRFVYDLYTRGYVNDGCLNYKVRPLVAKEVSSRLLRDLHPTLDIRWKLWEQWDQFCEMIKKTVKNSYDKETF